MRCFFQNAFSLDNHRKTRYNAHRMKQRRTSHVTHPCCLLFRQRCDRRKSKTACRSGRRRLLRHFTRVTLHRRRPQMDQSPRPLQPRMARPQKARPRRQGRTCGRPRRDLPRVPDLVLHGAVSCEQLSRKLRFFGQNGRLLRHVGRQRLFFWKDVIAQRRNQPEIVRNRSRNHCAMRWKNPEMPEPPALPPASSVIVPLPTANVVSSGAEVLL